MLKLADDFAIYFDRCLPTNLVRCDISEVTNQFSENYDGVLIDLEYVNTDAT